jgi:hypothetical protein
LRRKIKQKSDNWLGLKEMAAMGAARRVRPLDVTLWPAGKVSEPTMQVKKILPVSILAAIMAGCASTAKPPVSPRLQSLTRLNNLPGKPACFWRSSFQGDWTVLNESTLIVRAPLPKDAFVVKLFEPVFNLSFDQGIGFEDKEHTGQICNDGVAYLIVLDWQPRQIPIVAVHALTPDQEKQLLQAAGKPIPRIAGQPVAPKQ